MALVPCQECGKQISSAATACPTCGHPQTAQPAPDKYPKPQRPPEPEGMGIIPKAIIGAITIFILVLVFDAIRGGDPAAAERRRAQGAIELCWEEQQRKSLAPGDARFIAGACEQMEAKYIKNYGSRP